MKKYLCILILLVGCGSLHEDYVKQDRANYETLAPVISSLLAESKKMSAADKADVEDRLQGWDTKTTAALESIAKEKKQ